MNAQEAARQIAGLVGAGYLARSRREIQGIKFESQDEFLVVSPDGPEGRSEVLDALRDLLGSTETET